MAGRGIDAACRLASRAAIRRAGSQIALIQHSTRHCTHGHLQLRGHVSKLELRGLEVGNGAAKLLPLLRILPGGVQAKLGAADAAAVGGIAKARQGLRAGHKTGRATDAGLG